MKRSVILKGPIPTPEQMADSLGVPRSRLEQLRVLLAEDDSIGTSASRRATPYTKQRIKAASRKPKPGTLP